MTRPLTIMQAAEKVNRDEKTIRRWIKAGMQSQMLAGKRYIEKRTLLQWAVENGRRRGPSDPDE